MTRWKRRPTDGRRHGLWSCKLCGWTHIYATRREPKDFDKRCHSCKKRLRATWPWARKGGPTQEQKFEDQWMGSRGGTQALYGGGERGPRQNVLIRTRPRDMPRAALHAEMRRRNERIQRFRNQYHPAPVEFDQDGEPIPKFKKVTKW